MRRLKTTGSVYRRASDGRWFAEVEAGRTDDGRRTRRTVSSALYCQTLKRLGELGAVDHASIDRRDRAMHMEAARKLGTHTAGEWYAYLRKTNRTCEYCGYQCMRPTKDHRTPVSRGGSDGIDNLAVACFRCNNLKNDATEAEFREHIRLVGGLSRGHDKGRRDAYERLDPLLRWRFEMSQKADQHN